MTKQLTKNRKSRKLNVDGKLQSGEKELSSRVVAQLNITGGKKNVRSIDELLGRTDNIYSNGTIEEYEAKLRSMSTSDLERHATENGTFPNSNRKVLITRLLDRYRKTAGGYFNTNTYNVVTPKNPNKILDILKNSK